MFFFIEPEVAGGLGDGTIIDNSSHPPIVTKLEYRFEGWLGDDLLESFPCFIITEVLAQRISEHKFSGFSLRPVLITKSDDYLEQGGDNALREFLWVVIEGHAGVDDFGLAHDHRLVISDEVLKVLKGSKIDNADIEEFY